MNALRVGQFDMIRQILSLVRLKAKYTGNEKGLISVLPYLQLVILHWNLSLVSLM